MPLRSLIRKLRPACDRIVNGLGYQQSEIKIQSDAMSFWENHPTSHYGVISHWRGHGIFEHDDERWLSIGRRHRAIFQRLSTVASTRLPSPCRILEWGCGGGANAVEFGKIADQFVAVDISPKSIAECMHQMRLHGLQNGIGVVADIHQPEEAVRSIEPVDVVICTYVFELLPTREYAIRLLRLFLQSLRPGGLALIQIRYATANKSTQGRKWGYQFGFAKMVAFFIEEFWQVAAQAGFRPVCIELLPMDETVFDERYAYFLLEKEVIAT